MHSYQRISKILINCFPQKVSELVDFVPRKQGLTSYAVERITSATNEVAQPHGANCYVSYVHSLTEKIMNT